ncbi:unnamed protein product [Schistocephalus solidus]|uniref:DC_STAMP domain-containing protein n=1 Tax=Schistocephalus solidus TaxID=70667 RepID=A0A183SGB3_SCHSO|nr:unnamed protein product [Schistocephalus solidus]
MANEEVEKNEETGVSIPSSWWRTLQTYFEEAVNDANESAQEVLNLRDQIDYANQSNSGLVPEAFREDVSRVSNIEKRRSTQTYKSEKAMYDLLNRLEKPSCCTLRLRQIYHCLTDHCCNFDVKVFYEKPILWHTPAATLQIGFLVRENCLGLTAGLIIGFLAFAVFVMTFGHAPHIATLASCYVMLLAVFGISFSEHIRCVFMLVLPYLVAGRARWLLMVYATALTTMGPGLNFMHNSGNFRNAIGCVLGQVNTNLKLLDKITEAPMSLFGRQVKDFIQSANEKMQRMRNLLSKVKLSLFRVTRVTKTKNSWIKTLIAACGDETAMKNQCLAFFNALYFNCLSTMTSAGFICKLVRMFAEQSCKSVKGLNDICERQGRQLHSRVNATTPVSQEQIEETEAALLNLIGRKNVSMESGEFVDVDLSGSLSNKEQITSMIEERMDVLFDALDVFKNMLSWFLVGWTLFTVAQLVLQAALFRRNWMRKIYFDNVYLTPAFIRQEKHALENQLIMTLPLSFLEKRRYVPLSSFWWSNSEKRAAFSSFIFILVGILSIIMVMLADYTMYVVLVTTGPAFSSDFGVKGRKDQFLNAIPEFGRALEDIIQPKIEGNSSLASMARSLLALSNPLKDIAFDVDASVCRPKASPPSTTNNGLIGAAIIGMLITIVLQVRFWLNS